MSTNPTKTELQDDVSFLLGRSMKGGSFTCDSKRDTGISSNALVYFAYTGLHSGEWPLDRSDYAACVRAIRRLPRHRRSPSVMAKLREGKDKIK